VPGSRCLPENNGTDCQDGSTCNGEELCINFHCVGGPPPPVNDQDPCTVDGCNDALAVPVFHFALSTLDGSECTLPNTDPSVRRVCVRYATRGRKTATNTHSTPRARPTAPVGHRTVETETSIPANSATMDSARIRGTGAATRASPTTRAATASLKVRSRPATTARTATIVTAAATTALPGVFAPQARAATPRASGAMTASVRRATWRSTAVWHAWRAREQNLFVAVCLPDVRATRTRRHVDHAFLATAARETSASPVRTPHSVDRSVWRVVATRRCAAAPRWTAS